MSTPLTNYGVGWPDSEGAGHAAILTDSYFPAIESPRKLSDTLDTDSHPLEVGPGGPTRATSCPLPLALPPMFTPRSRPPSSMSATAPGAHFLLVDDNPINLRILCAYMKKLGRAFTTAVDGMEAVESFKANPGRFTCILMDINMPRLDGLKATQQIRSHERDTGVVEACAIFALTGLASAETQREAYESGVGLFLTKPVKLKELSEILRARGLI